MRVILLMCLFMFYSLLADHWGLNHLIDGKNKEAMNTIFALGVIYTMALDIIKK